ncbi:MAG: hypothetical protein AVDCRST_MAG96-788 [uncultured Segetibacter sp.]|uniref:Uncharacterized protein n=1 Tax=uncultured Segetibacter sp. TaxID=481133 RepID=A0A6J4RWM8_9BACT|nr:MAG: hypothetical protein AVDCRST_MAG96-788 [uncultured Segetibacter sp.]
MVGNPGEIMALTGIKKGLKRGRVFYMAIFFKLLVFVFGVSIDLL